MTKPLTTILTEIPDLVAEVWATREAPNPAPRADRHIRSMPGSRPPANLEVIDLLRTDPSDTAIIGAGQVTSHLLDRLGMLCRLVEEERSMVGLDQPEPGYGSWTGVTGYLTATLSWWSAERGVAGDVERDIRQVHGALERAAKVPHEVTYQCDRCRWPLEPQPGGEYLLCIGCGQNVPSAAKIRADLQRQKPMTAEAMERHWGDSLGISARDIADWKRRGWLTPVGQVLIERKWRPTFEPWDVLRVQQRNAGVVDLAETS